MKEDNSVNIDNFHFHLYVSFPRRSDSVALELFEALDALCKRENKACFTLYVRLSQERQNPERWNEDFIRREITQIGGKNIKRVWVCGPPVMNETFDRVFSDERGDDQNDESLLGNRVLGLARDQIEIL